MEVRCEITSTEPMVTPDENIEQSNAPVSTVHSVTALVSGSRIGMDVLAFVLVRFRYRLEIPFLLMLVLVPLE